MRILIAVPTFDGICPETFKSIYNLQSEHGLEFEFFKGYDCAIARNNIVQYALDGLYDYVLMVDSDVVIEWDTLNKMLEYPTDICLGFCPKKNTSDKSTCIIKPGTVNYEDNYHYDEIPKKDRIPVKGGGFACALISRRVLTTLSYPWFKYVVYNNHTFLSEDYYFCSHANANGFKIEADTRVRCGHLARYFQYE